MFLRANHGVELTGWGSMTANGNTSNKLQATSLIVNPQIVCNNSYNLNSDHPQKLAIESKLPHLFLSNIMCAGSSVST